MKIFQPYVPITQYNDIVSTRKDIVKLIFFLYTKRQKKDEKIVYKL